MLNIDPNAIRQIAKEYDDTTELIVIDLSLGYEGFQKIIDFGHKNCGVPLDEEVIVSEIGDDTASGETWTFYVCTRGIYITAISHNGSIKKFHIPWHELASSQITLLQGDIINFGNGKILDCSAIETKTELLIAFLKDLQGYVVYMSGKQPQSSQELAPDYGYTDYDRERISKIYVIGSAITFFVTFLAVLILEILKGSSEISNMLSVDFSIGRQWAIPLLSLTAAIIMTSCYCGAVAISKWYWRTVFLITKFLIGIWAAIFGAIWWTIFGALIMLALLISILWAAVVFGLIFYIMAISLVGFFIWIHKIGMSIRTLISNLKGLDEEDSRAVASVIFGIIQGAVSIGMFMFLFLSKTYSEALLDFKTTNWFTHSLEILFNICLLWAAPLFHVGELIFS